MESGNEAEDRNLGTRLRRGTGNESVELGTRLGSGTREWICGTGNKVEKWNLAMSLWSETWERG